MEAMDDMELIRAWAARGSEDAFKALVDRHINLVYSTAQRLLFNPHEAEEVTQTVFILLARKAGRLSPQTVLAGWLYRTTGYAAAQLLRAEGRRRHRIEKFSNMDPTQANTEANSVWERIQPLLEEAMSRLRAADRDALILRFMEEKSLREVGQALGLTEDAARKQVNRAVEKLRVIFGRRGVVTTSALLATALSASAASTTPIGLAASVTAAAISNGVFLTVSTSTLAKGTSIIMTWTKSKIAITAVVALLVGGTTTIIVNRKAPPVAVPEIGVANDDGRLGGPGNRQPDWRHALAQAKSPNDKEKIEQIWCVDNLKQVGGASREWALTHDNVFPGDFFVLKTQIAPRYLACPSDLGKTEATKWASTTTRNVSYVLVSPQKKDTRPNLVIVRCPIHGHVALSDGSVLQGSIAAQRSIAPDNTINLDE